MRNTYLLSCCKTATLLFALFFSTGFLRAQLTGTVTVTVEYPTIADFINDLNTNGVGPGGVTLEVPSGYSEIAPAGGFAITATGTAANTITITGTGGLPKPIVIANSALTVGALNDGIFKIIGGDYITISNLELNENAANLTTAAATNNMTEWGIALLYASTTDNANNCTISGNTIVLNRVYQNTFGIYANATHTATAVTTSATATGPTGGNSGLKIYSNDISNTNIGIVVVGPTAAADHNNVIEIGGSAITGNTISNYGTTGTFSSYANVSGTVNGILLRNSKNYTISNNSVTSSNGGTTAGTLRGIYVPSFSNAPTGTFTNNINSNTISVRSAVAAGTMQGIIVESTTGTNTSVLNINSNNFHTTTHTVAASGSVTFISNAMVFLNLNINDNTFTNLSVNTTGSVTFVSHSITIPAGGTSTASNNTIVTQFTKSGAGGSVVGFTTAASSPNTAFYTLTNNNFSNINVTGATSLTFINNTDGSGSACSKTITGNTFSNIIGGTSAIIGFSTTYWGGASSIIGNNTFSNITGQGSITGINIGNTFAGTASTSIQNNTISSLSSTGAGSTVTGITSSNTAPSISIDHNIVNGLSSTGASAISGIIISGSSSTNVHANKIYDITGNNAGSTVFGIQLTGGASVSAYNNLISGLTVPTGNGTDVIRGISVSSTSTSAVYRVYYNSVYLNAVSSGTNFGTTGIFHTASATPTTAALDLRNNIIINESVAMGTGLTVAYRRSGTALNNYVATSNRNLLYAGTPSATNLIFTDGTTLQPSFIAFQGMVVPRELNSFTGEAAFIYGTPGSFFISLTGSSLDFLRPLNGITTQVESGAENISTPLITTDFSSVTRAGNAGYLGTGTNPDLGAYEIEAISPAPVIVLNSVTPTTSTLCTTASRVVSVTITTISGTITGANLVYAFNGTAQTPIAMVNTSGNIWEATLPASVPVNATVSWGVTATNSIGLSSSYVGTSFADEPLFGVTATATASSSTICSTDPTQLTASLTKTGTIQMGTGTNLTGATAQPTAFCNRWTSYRMQTVYTAAELTAAGLSAGPITSITYNISTLGDGATNANYEVKMGPTGLSTFTDFVSTTGYTVVYPSATYTHAVGLNTVIFSTPYAWDGVSNIVIEVTHSGANLTNNSQTYFTPTAGNTVAWSTNGGATGTLSTNRLNLGISGNTPPTITAIAWMDGATLVGSTNPLTVNPATTTTYTANITAAGCSFSPSPTVTVNVNPLPSSVTATNSFQCGTQVPTASVTSTTGAVTPTFKWYDAATGGTLLQTSTSVTYTSNVASTTTFYVSEVDGVTGCESVRTAVTVTVAAADGISASANPTTMCIGSSVTLTAANTNPTPNQTYSYSWISTAGSGAETSVAGSPVTITPTLPGTYTYNLTGVDGLCNAVATTTITVDPLTATLSPIDATCNGVANGSFSLGTTTCGTSPFTYSVDSGSFGAIPTNLSAGTHSVVVKDANGFTTSPITITIGQPSTTITNPTVTNASVCQNDLSAEVTAAATVSVPTAGSVVVLFNVASQPTETNAAPGNIISSSTVTLPANATITSATLNYNGLTALGGSWMSDIRLGLSGSVTNTAAQGTGSGNTAGTFNYTRSITPGSVNVAGGTVNLLYWDYVNDNSAGPEATFPTGAGVASLTINYTVPSPATITWWDAPTNGTQIGSGSPFETVGTSVLPNTATPGVYTVYAQGQNGACPSPGRTAATITVNSPTTSMLMITACNTYTLNTQTYTSSGTYTQVITNAAGCDSTITLMLTINYSSTSTTTITACDSYTWTNGSTYTTSGTYTQTLVNAVGCDSVATLALTINYSNSSSQTVTACDSYTWSATGLTYSSSGMYMATLTNQAGCDSTAMLMLTINLSNSGSQTTTACNSYTWPATGITYTSSGMYMATLTNQAGCDSTVMLMLTINNSSASTTTITACNSYTWTNGTTYTSSGTYTQTLVNAVGCDSVATLALTINNSNSVTQTVSACVSYTWSATGLTYTSSGTYMTTLTNQYGCDSSLMLMLTINQPNSGSQTTTACNSYTWSATGITYTSSGMYMATIPNQYGCDSTVMLMLTINNSSSSTTAVTECYQYTWTNGTTYTISGTYTQTLTNAVGCDSIATLNLTINNSTTSSTTVIECDSYTWTDGTTYTASGTYSQILVNSVGCDSIANLVLTINNSSTSTTVVTECESFTWTDGNTYTNSGTFTQTLTNAVGCDSIATLVLTITGLPVVTATDNGDATITSSAGSSYAWIDCGNNTVIPGQTGQSFIVTANGSYASIVTVNGCSDTSNCVLIDYIGIKEISQEQFTVYPNPTLDEVTISMTAASAKIEIVDAQGKILQTANIVNGSKINLGIYENGVYYLRITTEDSSSLQRVVKN